MSQASPPSRTAGTGFMYVADDAFWPWAARALCANITGLASSARHQALIFN